MIPHRYWNTNGKWLGVKFRDISGESGKQWHLLGWEHRWDGTLCIQLVTEPDGRADPAGRLKVRGQLWPTDLTVVGRVNSWYGTEGGKVVTCVPNVHSTWTLHSSPLMGIWFPRMPFPHEAIPMTDSAGPCAQEGCVSHVAGSVMVIWSVEKQIK